MGFNHYIHINIYFLLESVTRSERRILHTSLHTLEILAFPSQFPIPSDSDPSPSERPITLPSGENCIKVVVVQTTVLCHFLSHGVPCGLIVAPNVVPSRKCQPGFTGRSVLFGGSLPGHGRGSHSEDSKKEMLHNTYEARR